MTRRTVCPRSSYPFLIILSWEKKRIYIPRSSFFRPNKQNLPWTYNNVYSYVTRFVFWPFGLQWKMKAFDQPMLFSFHTSSKCCSYLHFSLRSVCLFTTRLLSRIQTFKTKSQWHKFSPKFIYSPLPFNYSSPTPLKKGSFS